jgi:2-polyprenyl-6-methoxyphenol hydroxylase-like FAD-dependent oxidoreductase
MDNPGMPAAAPHNNPSRPVLIAGGGIGGMATALTLHQIGVPCIVFESVAQLQPLGVGINLQPNAVRELHDLGFGNDVLDTIGLQAREWALVGRNGNEIYAEPRGLQAGYRWPQYSVHRGQLQMMLFNAVKERLGEGAVRLGHRVTGYRQDAGGVTALIETRDGQRMEVAGALLVAADGLHSAVRAQMHPAQPPIQWGGAIMWRGTTPGVPVRTGASFVGLGSLRHRVVLYPITPPTPPRAWPPSTGSPRSRWTTRAAGRKATGTGAWRCRSSSTTSTAGTTAGSTCRPCCAAPATSSNTP